MKLPRKQRGAATLFISVMLLVVISMVALLSGKTVISETKIAANNYRASQAVAAASYAMDLGIDYFDTGGFDRIDESSGTIVVGNDGVMDSTIDINNDGVFDGNDMAFDNLSLASADGRQALSAELSFDNAGCGAAGTDFRSGKIIATGYSDDGTAKRTITRCVGPLATLIDAGPDQPLVAQGQVALTGNARIVNRFTSTTIWSGNQVTIGSSSAMETYIGAATLDTPSTSGDNTLDPNDPDDLARLLSIDEDADTQLVSNRNLGNGLDIIDDDTTLDTLVGIDFLKNFFNVQSRASLKLRAGSQVYDDIDLAKNSGTAVTSGLVWVEGDQSMTGGTIGSIEEPAIVYIHGDLDLNGGTVYGVLYIAGKYTVAGNPTVVGSNIVEGTNFSGATETPASPPIVTGHGTLSLIYWAGLGGNGNTNNPVGQTAVIAGSWHDWD